MALIPRLALRKFTTNFLDGQGSRCSNITQTANYYMKNEAKKSSNWRKFFGRAGFGGSLIVIGGTLALGHNYDGLDDEFVDKPLYSAYPGRAQSKISELIADVMEPRAQELLLPDLLPPPYQAPYTLLIELKQLLVHSTYSRTAGWRTKKRQGVDVFLESLCRHYEIVIFTRDSGQNCVDVIEAIDPKMCILYKLYKDSTRYKKGVHLKDLSNLNRDLSKVIVIDTSRESVACQPENAIVIPEWMGEDDLDLLDLADMLLVIGQDHPEDLRSVIKCYTELDDPINAYRMRRQEIIDEENQRKVEAIEKSKKSGGILGKKWW